MTIGTLNKHKERDLFSLYTSIASLLFTVFSRCILSKHKGRDMVCLHQHWKGTLKIN